jgi:hypothetical protein
MSAWIGETAPRLPGRALTEFDMAQVTASSLATAKQSHSLQIHRLGVEIVRHVHQVLR